jgi:pimeloyl-ACP methyl ester carboxylesterase
MAHNSIPPVPDRLAKWRSEGETVELMGRQIWYHDSGPKTDDAVFIVHGYPGSPWDFRGRGSHRDRHPDRRDGHGRFRHERQAPRRRLPEQFHARAPEADLYDALATHLGLKSVILLAHDMGQTVGLELMARFEENRTPFRIRHAILLDGSTPVDMIAPTEYQKQALAAPSTALPDDMAWDDMAWDDIYNIFPESCATESRARDDFDERVTCQAQQIYINHGSRTVSGIVHHLEERHESFGRWSRTLFGFQKAPMTLIWREQDPVAVIAMGDRIKKERPVTDLYKYQDCAHWPSIEYPDRIGDAILARLGSV